MTSRRFVGTSLLLYLVATASLAGVHVVADPFGLFRSTGGPTRTSYGDERAARYLMSLRYIPENFDGLLVGMSLSGNIDTSRLTGVRVYNASINGGTVTEIALVAANALRLGSMKILVVGFGPQLVGRSGFLTDSMKPRERLSALGSVQSLRMFASQLAVALGWKRWPCTPYGVNAFQLMAPPRTPDEVGKVIRESCVNPSPLPVDEEAFREFAGMVRAAHERGTRVLVYYHPVPRACYVNWGDSHRVLRERVAALLEPGDLAVNFNDDAYRAFTEDPANYFDTMHLTGQGAERVLAELQPYVDQVLAGNAAERPRDGGER